MALGTIDILERVRNRIAPDAPLRALQKLDYTIETVIPGALSRVGRAIAQSSEYKTLQKDYAATPAAGIVDLSTGTYNDLLVDSIERNGSIQLTSGTTPVVKAPRFQSLFSTLQSDTVHYAIRGRKVYLKAAGEVGIGTFVTAITITANFIPTIATLPSQFEDTFIDIICEMVLDKAGPRYLAQDDASPMPMVADGKSTPE
jgi:hypothetical protein